MAKFISPEHDLTKLFYIIFNSKADEKDFFNNGGIFTYKPFLEYINNFNDNYGYTIQINKCNNFLGNTVCTHTYTIRMFKLSD